MVDDKIGAAMVVDETGLWLGTIFGRDMAVAVSTQGNELYMA